MPEEEKTKKPHHPFFIGKKDRILSMEQRTNVVVIEFKTVEEATKFYDENT